MRKFLVEIDSDDLQVIIDELELDAHLPIEEVLRREIAFRSFRFIAIELESVKVTEITDDG